MELPEPSIDHFGGGWKGESTERRKRLWKEREECLPVPLPTGRASSEQVYGRTLVSKLGEKKGKILIKKKGGGEEEGQSPPKLKGEK